MLEIVGILTLMIVKRVVKFSKASGILNKCIRKSFLIYFIICYQINNYKIILFQNTSNLNQVSRH